MKSRNSDSFGKKMIVWAKIGLFLMVLGVGVATAQTSSATASSQASANQAGVTTTRASDPKEITPILAEQPKTASPFQFDIGIPAWATAISGVTGVKGVTGNVNQSFSSLWSHVDDVVPLSLGLRYEKWGVSRRWPICKVGSKLQYPWSFV
jgi:hypothetical protein